MEHVWLVVSTPLKNMSSSVGIIIPNICKNKIHVPNQPDIGVWDILLSISGYVFSTPLKNMSSSVGIMTFPIYGKINVPNHHFVPLCVSHCLGLGRQCFDCGDSTVKAAAKPE